MLRPQSLQPRRERPADCSRFPESCEGVVYEVAICVSKTQPDWRPLVISSWKTARRPLESAKPRKNRGPANPFYSVIILCSHRGFEGPQVSPCSFCLPWSCAVLRLWFLQGEQVQVGRDWVLLCSCAAFRRLKHWMLFHVMRDPAKAASKSQGLSAVTLPKGALQTRDVLSSQEHVLSHGFAVVQ